MSWRKKCNWPLPIWSMSGQHYCAIKFSSSRTGPVSRRSSQKNGPSNTPGQADEGRGARSRERRLAFGVRRSAFGVWRLAFGVWRLAFGVPPPGPAGSRIPRPLPKKICFVHSDFRPNRVLAAAPSSVWRVRLTYDLSLAWLGFRASRWWCAKRVAPSLWSGTHLKQHAECNAPPAWTMARVSPFTFHLSPITFPASSESRKRRCQPSYDDQPTSPSKSLCTFQDALPELAGSTVRGPQGRWWRGPG